MTARLRRTASALLFALSASACGPSGTPPAKGPVPIAEEPRHRPVFQNGIARVLDVRVPAGDTTGYHVHAAPNVGITIESARTWAQPWGGTPGGVEPSGAVGDLFDNWSRALPYTHRVGNADSVAFHYVVGEWLGTSGRSCGTPPADGERRVVKDGQRFQVIEIRLAPHAALPAHVHACPGLLVLATPGTLDEEGPAAVARGGAGAGAWAWHDADHRHALHNPGDTPLTVFEIDWR
jgi:quercetin dioxygenase-like cupin family protein